MNNGPYHDPREKVSETVLLSQTVMFIPSQIAKLEAAVRRCSDENVF